MVATEKRTRRTAPNGWYSGSFRPVSPVTASSGSNDRTATAWSPLPDHSSESDPVSPLVPRRVFAPATAAPNTGAHHKRRRVPTPLGASTASGRPTPNQHQKRAQHAHAQDYSQQHKAMERTPGHPQSLPQRPTKQQQRHHQVASPQAASTARACPQTWSCAVAATMGAAYQGWANEEVKHGRPGSRSRARRPETRQREGDNGIRCLRAHDLELKQHA